MRPAIAPCRRNCNPFVIGIRMSRMMAFGSDVVGELETASAESAVATPKPSSLSIRANVSATDRSSSTIRIVRVAGSASALGRGNHRIILKAKDMAVKAEALSARVDIQ